jgi:hypothetical protein
MIICNFENKSGFFSMFFFFVNQYIYAVKNNLNLKINSNNWLFKYNLGWEDYFQNIDIINKETNKNENIICNFDKMLGNYKLLEYKNILDKIYIYNQNTIKLIKEKKEELKINNIDYASIFIRRGDKLIKESNFIESHLYLEYLLSLNPNYKTIYLQTDDYNCYLELKEYILNKNLKIKIITLCKETNKGGMVIFKDYKHIFVCDKSFIKNNIDYIEKNIDSLKELKPVTEMNNKEIYEHTLDMIIGLDIVLNSSLVITDYSSNVARFLKLKHNNIDRVYDIVAKTNILDLNRYICPSYNF